MVAKRKRSRRQQRITKSTREMHAEKNEGEKKEKGKKERSDATKLIVLQSPINTNALCAHTHTSVRVFVCICTHTHTHVSVYI